MTGRLGGYCGHRFYQYLVDKVDIHILVGGQNYSVVSLPFCMPCLASWHVCNRKMVLLKVVILAICISRLAASSAPSKLRWTSFPALIARCFLHWRCEEFTCDRHNVRVTLSVASEESGRTADSVARVGLVQLNF